MVGRERAVIDETFPFISMIASVTSISLFTSSSSHLHNCKFDAFQISSGVFRIARLNSYWSLAGFGLVKRRAMNVVP
jgi:hypothetical protein